MVSIIAASSVLLLVVEGVMSQGLKLPPGQRWMDRSSSTCDSSSTCMARRLCQAARNQRDGQLNLRPCGERRGRRRRNICCPIEEDSVEIPREQREPTNEVISSINSQTCGTSSSRSQLQVPFVMGGDEARQGMFPWMVAILKKNRRGDREDLECTGFLIDMRHLLTAAHCFQPNDPARYSLRIGNVDWRRGSSYDVARIDIPEGYRRGMYYDDIAVVTISREVTEPGVVPICLPTREVGRRNLTGTGTTVAGWGSESFGGAMSDTLNYLTGIPVISNTDCNQRLERNLAGFRRQFNRGVPRGLLCAGFLEGGRDSCGGDSGGPLMIQQNGVWYAVGIVSFGYECGRPGYPAGYTRISEYLDYIRRITRS